MYNAVYIYILTIVGVSMLSYSILKKKESYYDVRTNQTIAMVDLLNSQLKHDTINRSKLDSLHSVILEMSIERQSFFEMMERQSDWFIYIVSGLFGILGLIGFGVFKYEMSNIIEVNSNQITEQQNHHEAHKREFKELKTASCDARASIFWMDADRNSNNTYLFIRNCIAASSWYVESFKLSNEDEAIRNAKICLNNVEIRLTGNVLIREFSIKDFNISGMLEDLKNIAAIGDLFELSSSVSVRLNELYKTQQEPNSKRQNSDQV